MSWWQRVAVAMGVCLLVYEAVALRVIGTLLHQYQQPGAQAYGPGVFTSPSLSTKSLLGAAGPDGLWTTAGAAAGSGSIPDRLVYLHLVIDLSFAVLIALMLLGLLRAVSNELDRLMLVAALVYLLLAWAGTAFSIWAFDCSGIPPNGHCAFGIGKTRAVVIHLLADAKWAWLVLVLIVVVLRFASTAPDHRGRLRPATILPTYRGLKGVPGTPPGLVVIVVVYLALIALPAGGALDQLPDVLRADADRTTWHHLSTVWWPLVGLFLFAVTLLAAGAPGTKPVRTARMTTPQFVVMWLVAVVPLVVYVALDHPVRLPAPSSAAIAITLAGAYLLAKLAHWTVPGWQGDPAKDEDELDHDDDGDALKARLTVSVLVGGVVLGAALGELRATLPVVVLPDPGETYWWLFWGGCAVAIVVAPLVGAAVYWLLKASLKPDDREAGTVTKIVLGVGVVVSFLAAAAAVFLAVDPRHAGQIGAIATLTIALSGYVAMFGAIGFVTRHWAWAGIRRPQRPSRTPWAGLLVVAWIVASLADVQDGYHDARTTSATDVAASRDTLTHRWGEWVTAWNALPPRERRACSAPDGSIPLVLVAAPGGGAKAAYWTAIGMDRLFGDDGVCPISLFAASGVSGGAVGLTVSLAIPPSAPGQRIPAGRTTSAETETAKITDEAPLTETLAGMLLRDVPRPLTGLRDHWTDRAGLMEEAWSRATPVLPDQAAGNATTKSVEDLGRGWWEDAQGTPPTREPMLMLNGTSVTDGCRAIVTTVDDVSVSPKNCLAAPLPDRGITGSDSATVDVLGGLLPSTGYAGGAEGKNPAGLCSAGASYEPQTLPATTAALLAARFPYVTPSGALRRCVQVGSGPPVVVTSYVVDGGYLENTGLLSLLQTWHGLSDVVRMCNDRAASPSAHQDRVAVPCPHTAGGMVEPWVVMLENHYTSRATAPSPKRPHELLVPPVTALTKKATTIGTPALEQATAAEIDAGVGGTTGRCSRFFALAPDVTAAVQAPLGWVLAPSTRTRMSDSMDVAWSNVAEAQRQQTSDLSWCPALITPTG